MCKSPPKICGTYQSCQSGQNTTVDTFSKIEQIVSVHLQIKTTRSKCVYREQERMFQLKIK